MHPRTLRLLLAYDGTGFRGWAAQRDRSTRTVEREVAEAIENVVNEPVKLSVAGRTDAGVHARGQVASFVTGSSRETSSIRDAVNGRLAPEVVVSSVTQAPAGFDARFSATAREYRYRIDLGEVPDPFTAAFVWHRPGAPDVRAMRQAARAVQGERDFRSFCRHPGAGRSTIRDLQRLSVWHAGDRLELAFRANAFLHQMVRALTGMVLAVGEGKVDPGDVPAMLAARDRAAVPQIAPPHGLTLERVMYGRNPRLHPREL
ncbi:MAG: tRNA pseudouridine(38-40) synthase TruA [Actinomycetota bacterium]|nr:tRNA pseudouridine(38-40) synthase TruA [Actinomycetota bacterium]MDH5314134.1 tRNA pseudouridine(38-40) synthase TruA [Actinomycetota bacterium]